MLWFEGTIPDAINSAKQRNLIFVVVIAGEDEQSLQLMSSWEDGKVSEVAQRSCVAIKVHANSDACVQFSQIYPVVCIPSSFFIGENGIPLEVIGGSMSAEELIKRIHKVNELQMHTKETAGAPVSPETSNCVSRAPETSADVPSGSAETSKELSPSKTDEGNFSSSQLLADNASSDPSALCSEAAEDLDAKVERITKKLEERREQKKKGEDEADVRKEMERRQLGRNLQDFKRKQEDEKTKRLLEERNREKAEEKAARERVKQQIAMDRAERAVRYAQNREEEAAAKQAVLQARQAELEARKETALRERSTVARIQFRLPDGSSFTNQFPSQSRLQEAWDFAVKEVGNRYGKFSLATMFPRREFTKEDLNKTLAELHLCPSASVVLLPQSSRPSNAVVQSSGGIWAALGSLFYPLLAVWRFLSSFLFAAPAPPPRRGYAQRPDAHANPQSAAAAHRSAGETPPKQNAESRPPNFKKDGKICRLRTQEDSEDDNNTWNGNSTQQM